jgi:nuclear GTP-binding protein
VAEIVARANAQDLMIHYNLPAFSKDDPVAFLSTLARANGFIQKGGAPDLTSAARIVLREWSTDKLLRYTMPATASAKTAATTTTTTAKDAQYERDAQILSTVRTRRDIRKAGAIRMVPGPRETRAVVLDAPWFDAAAAPGSGSADDDGEEAEGDVDMDDGSAASEEAEGSDENSDDRSSGEDSDEVDDEDEDEEPLPPPSSKRKRRDSVSAPAPAPPSVKKVAFAKDAKGPSKPTEAAPTVPKSALKKPAAKAAAVTLKPTKNTRKAAPLKKVGNAGGALRTTAADSEAYDFTKFF